MKVAIFFALVAVVAGRALDDDCATCKTVVAAVDAQLKSNATLTEIENTVNKICDAIPGISDQCKQYVKQYVPEVGPSYFNIGKAIFECGYRCQDRASASLVSSTLTITQL